MVCTYSLYSIRLHYNHIQRKYIWYRRGRRQRCVEYLDLFSLSCLFDKNLLLMIIELFFFACDDSVPLFCLIFSIFLFPSSELDQNRSKSDENNREMSHYKMRLLSAIYLSIQFLFVWCMCLVYCQFYSIPSRQCVCHHL